MGCDIHLYAEKRVDGKWVTADEWEPDEYDDEGFTLCVPYEKRIYDSRNYYLFSILADVRNGCGFAGSDTGDQFIPIATPRGLPEDVTPKVKKESGGWGGDGHSYSFFTVAELLGYDWTQTATLRGWVTAKEYEEWQRMIRWVPGPKSYCAGVGGRSVKHVTETEMKALIQGGVEQSTQNLRSTYCKISWQDSYHGVCKVFWWDAIPKLLALGAPEDVRIVFWFDN